MMPVDLPPSIRVLERGWLSSNSVVLFDNDHAATVVDTGYVTHKEQTCALITHALAGHRLTRIVNTHLHSDHCGGNAALKQRFGASILIPPGHADAVTTWNEEVLSFAATGQQCDRFVHDGVLAPGSAITLGGAQWDVHAAPGHDPHSIILWNAHERILISADALWANGFGVIFPEIDGESGFAEQRAVLQLVARLAPRVVIPGHGAPFDDVGAALSRAHARLDSLSASRERNARHAAKVLIKFHLLDVRRIALSDLVTLAHGASYFRLINERYFGLSMDVLVRRQVQELVAIGAAAIDGDAVVNREP